MDRLLFVCQTMKILRWNIEQVNKVLFNNYHTLIHNLIDLGDSLTYLMFSQWKLK
jgi:hypothetical protein